MTQPQDADELLERARRALSPREADEARVLAALSERLFGAPAAADGGEIASRTLPVPPPAAQRARGLVRWLWRAVLPLTAAGALGLVWHGPRGHEPAASAPSVAAPQQAAPQQAAVQLPVAPVLALEPPSAPDPSAPRELPKPEKKKPVRKPCRAANGGGPPCTSRPASPAPTALAAQAEPPAPPSSLRLELDALRSAERALREHRPQDALNTLLAFEHTVGGGGAMQEERAAATSIARCALATQSRDALVSAFVRRYPASAYAARVRQSCQRP